MSVIVPPGGFLEPPAIPSPTSIPSSGV